MTPMTMPVIRFQSQADRDRAMTVLADQQFESRLEGEAALSVTPAIDLVEAYEVLLADGFECMITEIEVKRLGPVRPQRLG